MLFSIVAAPTCIPTSSVGEQLFFTSSPAFIICRLFDDGHSDWCEVLPCNLHQICITLQCSMKNLPTWVCRQISGKSDNFLVDMG